MPYRHQFVPTHDFTVRSAFPYAWPDSNPASTSSFQIEGRSAFCAPNRSIRCPPVILVYSPSAKRQQLKEICRRRRRTFLGDLAKYDKLVRSDLSSRDTRNDREGTVPLNIRHISVVCILISGKCIELRLGHRRKYLRMVYRVHDVLVPERRKNTSNGGLADFASDSFLIQPGSIHNLGEGLKLLYPMRAHYRPARPGSLLGKRTGRR